MTSSWRPAALAALLPGLLIALALAGAAVLASRYTPAWLGAPAMALIAGIALRLMMGGAPAIAMPGLSAAYGPILKAAVVLLGLRLGGEELAALGWSGAGLAIAAVAVGFAATLALARVMGVDRDMARVMAAGISICGASAALAAGAALKARQEAVTTTLAAITLIGGIAMVLIPVIAHKLGMAPVSAGIWAGASLHELAHATGAAAALDEEASAPGVGAKLVRVAMLAPVLMLLAPGGANGKQGLARLVPPWFVTGFVIAALIAWQAPLPDGLTSASAQLAALLFCAALAGLGLAIDPRGILRAGWRPIVLCALASLVLLSATFAGAWFLI
ncbi:YeiH family protein [Alkalicaulis satelles]|uniref:YeiH family protein n=1 Tax=Alkalicaulis satelles TaxID=2609175 RepID=UPI0018ED7A38|nr:putative sulfate exporter family transporter [Alkalicaulis satelles]